MFALRNTIEVINILPGQIQRKWEMINSMISLMWSLLLDSVGWYLDVECIYGTMKAEYSHENQCKMIKYLSIGCYCYPSHSVRCSVFLYLSHSPFLSLFCSTSLSDSHNVPTSRQLAHDIVKIFPRTTHALQ